MHGSDKALTTVVKGSLQDMADKSGKSLAETIIGADAVVIVDTSGSMSAGDSRNGKTRYDVACDELAKLQERLPGKLAVVSFSDDTVFCPGGQPIYMGSGTDLAKALEFCFIADGCGIRFILISDGEPNEEREALAVAARYESQIDTIFVGPENDRAGGRAFLNKLANLHKGQSVTADRAKELAPAIQYLLQAW